MADKDLRKAKEELVEAQEDVSHMEKLTARGPAAEGQVARLAGRREKIGEEKGIL